MTDTTTIDVGPLVAAFAPFIVSAVVTIAGAAITAAAAAFVRWTGLQVQQSALDTVRAAAANEAGKLVAGSLDNFATAKVTIASPVVGAAAAAIVERIPDAWRASGITTDRLNAMILGEIGRIQASMTRVTPSAAP